MPRRPWTDPERSLLRTLYPHRPTQEIADKLNRSVTTVYQQAARLKLRKTPEFLASPLSGLLTKGHTRPDSVATQFRKGHIPANKGLRRPGWSAGRMAETQFRKGERRGQAAQNWKPIGTVLPDAEGYLRLKVRDAVHGKEATGFGNTKVWPLLRRHVWEQHFGAIPKGYVIAFKDGWRQNCEPENLECISRTELARRNRMWNRYGRELAELMQLTGALNRKIRSKKGHHGKK